MCAATRLSADLLHRSCRPDDIPFNTTAEVHRIPGVVGQDRAVQALRFGIGMRRHGYNLFAIGPPGVGKQTLLRQFLGDQAAREPVPADWCYVHDFTNPARPRALELPPGMGVRLQRDMAGAVAELRVVMRSTFESEEYRTRKQQIIGRFKERQERAMTGVQERARRRDIEVLQTGMGIAVAPVHDGAAIDPESFQRLPAKERERYQAAMEEVGAELQELLRKFHQWGREHYEELKALDREMAAASARHVLGAVRRTYRDLPEVVDHLAQVEEDVVDNADNFLDGGQEGVEAALKRALKPELANGPSFRRYQINVLVDRTGLDGAPVIYEDNPTHANLIGAIEHETQFGALITNFTLIKAGALHRAIGGYLVLDALKVLQQPFAWEALKRMIRSGEIRIESLGQAIGLVPTVSLEPVPIPLGPTKLVLTGERMLYYLLSALDPEFLELFKVLVDFEETMDRRPETESTYASLVATLVSQEKLRPFERGAVARVIDHAARSAGDAEKLSVQMRGILDLLRESDYWAASAGRDVATAADVQQALDAQRLRSGRVRERLQEAIRRDDILVTTSGEAVGQVNGLSVFQIGEHAFGHPTRLTARVRLGKGEVVDIEREVKLGGPLHSKGVLILAGFLGSRYATKAPLSLSGTIVFEQSYAGVEGDSASLAELCTLLSALAELPVRQSLAVTGSINQHGQVQAIGGVNEKIEGFFDICQQRGLTGEQGVIVPKSNVKNLMLRQDVVEAVAAGRFHVHAVEEVDDALELLTGTTAGARDGAGSFPEGSVNARVEARLMGFAEAARAFVKGVT
ncbi:MAG: AAA family ATPase [Vicinamibacterales bacterium]